MGRQHAQGFSLIELSIVLVAVGLIVAAVISSSTAIHNAKMRVAIKDVNEIFAAINSFEEIYHYLPGDFPHATTYWSSTGNGDGDWLVGFTGSTNDNNGEDYRVFEQLKLAGLYDSNTSYDTKLTEGTSIPYSSFKPGAYWFAERNGMHALNLGNALTLGSYTDNNALNGGFMTSTDARSIDEKMDDGLASSGYAHAAYGTDIGSGCVTGAWGASGVTYDLGSSVASCRLVFFYSKRP